MYCEEENRCLLPVNKNGTKNISNNNGRNHNTTSISREENEPPQKKNYSNFFHRFLEPNIGAAIIGIFGSLILHHLNYINHQQNLVIKYIESVQVLLLDEHHESKKRKDPEITPEHIELFIKSKASATIKHIKNEQARNSLISFLRQSKIGFEPRDGESHNDVLYLDEEQKEKPYSDLIKRIDLAHATLNDSDLAFIVLENANLTGIRLLETGLSKANLIDSRLREADLRGANLTGADLSEARLIDAKLAKSLLRLSFSWTWPLIKISGNEKTNLFDATLTGANLTGANLKDATLTGANLKDATLTGANLKGATFDLRINPTLNETQIRSACNWQQAIYKAEWDQQTQKYIPVEPHNTDYIQKLNDDNSSPQTTLDCNKWN